MTSQLFEFFIDERLDQTETLTLRAPASSSKAYMLNIDVDLRWRGRRFYIAEVEDERDGTETTKRVEANASWYRLGDTTRVGSTFLSAVTATNGLETLLTDTGWQVGSVTSSPDEFTMEEQDKSVLYLLRQWAKITGRFLVFNSAERTVDLLDGRGRDLGLGFRYRRNVTRIRRRTQPPEVTVLFPYGAEGLTIAGVNNGLEYLEDFSYYTSQGITIDEARSLYTRSKVWNDTSFLVDTELLAAAEARLLALAQPTVSYELDVVDLSELVPAEDQAPAIVVGDIVRVEDPDFGEDLRTTVVRTVRYPYEPWRDKVELAYLLNPLDLGATNGSRPTRSTEWTQFVGPVTTGFHIRNDADFVVARIPLAFRDGGRANYHVDISATGVGDGVMVVEVVDQSDGGATVFRPMELAYVDGAEVRATLSWAATSLLGQKDYRVRITTVADGGPSSALGVNVREDTDDEASFWILAQGAIQQTPVAENSERFEFTGARQTFTVPDNVQEVEVEVAGSAGGNAYPFPATGASGGGAGGIVTAKIAVVPGSVYEVVVGGQNKWPNGGAAFGSSVGDVYGANGGGSSWIVLQGDSDAEGLIHAGAGGGGGGGRYEIDTVSSPGGDAGFSNGDAAPALGGPNQSPAGGASQSAGGIGGTAPGVDGNPGTFLTGGDGGNPAPDRGGGGGGGGWYGGGGAGAGGSLTNAGGGGGGGSGWIDPSAYDVLATDGGNVHEDGYVEFRWNDPL